MDEDLLGFHAGNVGILNDRCQVSRNYGLNGVHTVTFCWSRYLLKYDNAAYVKRHASNLPKNLRSSGDLSQVSLYINKYPKTAANWIVDKYQM